MLCKTRLFTAVAAMTLLTGYTMVEPEKLTVIDVSNQATNRVICPGIISDVIYPKEKPVEIMVSGENIFVKFLFRRDLGEEKPYTGDIDMYVVCSESVYHMIMKAGKAPPATVALKSDIEKIKKGMDIFGGLPHETRLLRFLRFAYTERYPDGVTVTEVMKPADVEMGGLTVTLKRTAVVHGSGLKLNEYMVTPEDATEFRETDFLPLAKKPLLVAFEKNKVQKGDATRLFVIESSEVVK